MAAKSRVLSRTLASGCNYMAAYSASDATSLGRNDTARKDTSLGKAFVAFDARDYAKAQTLATIAYNKLGYEEAALMLAGRALRACRGRGGAQAHWAGLERRRTCPGGSGVETKTQSLGHD